MPDYPHHSQYPQDDPQRESFSERSQNGHYDHAASEEEELSRADNSPETAMPAELHTVEALVRADSANWAQHHLPAASRVMSFASGLAASDAPLTHSATSSLRDAEVAVPPASIAAIKGADHARRSPNRWPRLLSIAAAALIVLSLGALFISFAPGRFGVASHPKQAATPQRSHTTPTKWTVAPHLSAEQEIPMIAPSDPRVIYEHYPGNSTELRRSDDGGATWQTLAIPQLHGSLIKDSVPGSIAISPANANDIVLDVTVDLATYDGSYCPAGTLAPGQYTVNDASLVSGAHPTRTLGAAQHDTSPISKMSAFGYGVSCDLEYASNDGGLHWTLLHLPLGGLLTFWGNTNPLDTQVLQAQGDALYSSFQAGQDANTSPLGSRIVSSSDGGLSWSLADQSLVATGNHICNFLATPTGMTLFAFTIGNDCSNAHGQYTLWRSDDAGVHWQKVTTLASNDVQLAKAVQLHSSMSLYAFFNTTFEMSADGGKSWQPISMQGIPANLRLMSWTGLVSTSAGNTPLVGSFAEKSQPVLKTIVCYLWQSEKNAWQQVSPPIQDGAYTLNYDYLLVTQDMRGNSTLWLVMSVADSDATPVVPVEAPGPIPSSSHIVVESVPLN